MVLDIKVNVQSYLIQIRMKLSKIACHCNLVLQPFRDLLLTPDAMGPRPSLYACLTIHALFLWSFLSWTTHPLCKAHACCRPQQFLLCLLLVWTCRPRGQAPEQGCRNLRWAGLWERGTWTQSESIDLSTKRCQLKHCPAFRMLMARWDEVSEEDGASQGWFISSLYGGKAVDITSGFRGERHKAFQRGWDLFQKIEVESFGRGGSC